MNAHVVRAGLLTTVQDLGRTGNQRWGVPVGGAMDAASHRLANRLVGNGDRCATLECTGLGPVLVFERDALIALTGARPAVTAAHRAVPMDRPILLRAGVHLACGAPWFGFRTYVAVGGGIDVPPVLGSRSTYVPASFGGHEGRALRAGDALPVGPLSPLGASIRRLLDRSSNANPFEAPPWSAAHAETRGDRATIRLIRGPEWHRLTAGSTERITAEPFWIGPDSNRMGCRLLGPRLELVDRGELISQPVCPGTVQLPPGGSPILLTSDCATTGGYPRIGFVARVDLPRVGRLRLGASVRFQWISVEEARAETRRWEASFARWTCCYREKISGWRCATDDDE